MAGSVDKGHSSQDEFLRASLDGSDEPVNQELASIIPMIAETMTRQTNSFSSAFYIYDPELSRTVATFRHGEAEILFPDIGNADATSPLDVPIEADIIANPRSIRRSTPADFDRHPMIFDALRDYTDDYADVAVPLRRGARVYGVVYLWRYGEPGPFTDAEIVEAEQLANVAAMAVEFARQYSNERVRRLRLDALLNVASLAASHMTVDDVMPALTRILRTITEADVCNLYVFDEDGELVSGSYSNGLNARERWVFEESDQFPVKMIPAEVRAQQTLEPVVVRDPERDLAPGSQLVSYACEADLSEILVVPIVYQSKMIGVIYLWYRDGTRTFSSEAISTVHGIASQAGGVIFQARLHDSSQQHISETEALRRIGEAVLHSDSLDDVLDQIVDVLAQMIPHDCALVGRIKADQGSIVISRVWGSFPQTVTGYHVPLSQSLMGEVLHTGKVLNLADAFADPRMHRYQATELPVRSVLIAPLIAEDRTIGVLYIGRGEAGRFSDRQSQLMTLLAQQAAAAIARTQAREALALHARRQAFLAGVVNRLLAVSQPHDALQEICELGCGVLADGVAIALSSWEYGVVRWHGAAHLDPDCSDVLHRSLVGGSVQVNPERAESILASQEPRFMAIDGDRPAGDDGLHPTVVELLRNVGARQVLNVPMQQRGRASGVLVLISSSDEHGLDDDVQQMAQNVANRIGDALERHQMVRNRKALLRVSEAINAHTELDELLEMFASELHRIVPYDSLYLGKQDEAFETTTPLIFVNPLGLSKYEVEVASNRGISGEVMRTRRALLDNYAHRRESTYYGTRGEEHFYGEQGESAMAAPLVAKGSVIGVLFISRVGANRFAQSDFETFLLFAGLAASAIQRTELLQNNQLMYRASVEVLAAVVDAKDPTTLEHSRNVAKYARIIAEEAQLNATEIERIELAGLLHDIGKLSIPDFVLSKPGPLTQQERALINTHPDRGANILVQHPSLLNLAPLVRYHHERFDGTGYPDGLSGDQIPLGASIISVADALDTMTSERTYQRRKSISEALDELQQYAGSQFHPEMVTLLVQTMRRGSAVDLRVPGPELEHPVDSR